MTHPTPSSESAEMGAAAEPITRVVIFPRGQLSEADRFMFIECGILVAEADDPKAVTQINMRAPMVLESTIVSSDAVLKSLLGALAQQPAQTSGGGLTSAGAACHEFVKLLAVAIGAAP